MPPSRKTANATKNRWQGPALGFEATLWQAADELRNDMDAAEYEHVVLGLVFLKYIYISVGGQRSNPTTRRLAKMNLAIRGIDGNRGPQNANSFHRDLRPDLKADCILASLPFRGSDWGGKRLRDDKRWVYDVPRHDVDREWSSSKSGGEVLHA